MVKQSKGKYQKTGETGRATCTNDFNIDTTSWMDKWPAVNKWVKYMGKHPVYGFPQLAEDTLVGAIEDEADEGGDDADDADDDAPATGNTTDQALPYTLASPLPPRTSDGAARRRAAGSTRLADERCTAQFQDLLRDLTAVLEGDMEAEARALGSFGGMAGDGAGFGGGMGPAGMPDAAAGGSAPQANPENGGQAAAAGAAGSVGLGVRGMNGTQGMKDAPNAQSNAQPGSQDEAMAMDV